MISGRETAREILYLLLQRCLTVHLLGLSENLKVGPRRDQGCPGSVEAAGITVLFVNVLLVFLIVIGVVIDPKKWGFRREKM